MKSGKKRRTRISDKWAKTNVLIRDKGLRGYVPLTKKLSKSAISSMLGKYGMVYVKPVHGSLGKGVMKTEREAGGKYAYQVGGKRRSFGSFNAFYGAIKREAGGKRYLVQKGIHLLKYEGRAFDLRVVVQKSPRGGYEATGTVARVAYPGKIVTNGSQGGTILQVDQVLQPHAHYDQRAALISHVERIGIQTIKRLKRRYPSLVEIGLDVAIDGNLKPWILEVNTTPDHCPFAILQDQTMINRIIHYGKHYGVTYKLKCNKARRVL
ncbi:YheC/YheD family protein [Paenibacillus sp. LHD-117]|uniref:YheC/YheD family protein n=1 Tax=Paenibacillus sp. LHD-117 TaxID=3071412 RepID=UPI0027DF11F1|nr:YheC/YheD family protein [Paenibacillus sp. LHD-117]MDQ6423346.1 YheC/YheD family protein [Paenibacillus sp. LHD-117]